MITPEDSARVEQAVATLSEHFDSVQVFVTKHEGDGTGAYANGVGNWWARYGHVRSWVDRKRETELVEVRKDGEG